MIVYVYNGKQRYVDETRRFTASPLGPNCLLHVTFLFFGSYIVCIKPIVTSASLNI